MTETPETYHLRAYPGPSLQPTASAQDREPGNSEILGRKCARVTRKSSRNNIQSLELWVAIGAGKREQP